MLGRVHHEFLLWETCNRTLKSMYNTNLARILPKQVYSPSIIDWTVLNTLGCGDVIEEMLKIKVYEMEGDEFEEEGTDEELTSKKLIKFRLRGRAHSLTILEFARHLGFYTNDEIQDEGFETYFHGGLRNDDHFNTNEYWLSISSKDELILSRSYDKVQRNELWLMNMVEARNRKGYANVAWLIAKWMKRKGVRTEKESMICCRQFVTKITKRIRVLTEEVLNGLSALTYCRPLDATTLRELISSNERYAGVFEYMTRHYRVPQQGDYAPLSYEEQQEQDEE
ncbi:hypothetical protein Tco_0693995 [Tanacetum coccineum]